MNDNVILGDFLLHKIAEAEKKAKNDSERANIRLGLSSKYGYMAPATLICSFSKTLLGAVFAIAFLASDVKDLNETLFGLDLSISPKEYLASRDRLCTIVFIILAVAIVLKAAHENMVQRHLIFSETKINHIIDILLIIIALLLPSAFTIYWVLFELIELTETFLITTYAKEKRLKMLVGRQKKQKR